MKKTLSILFASILILSILPMTAFAAERDPLYADIKNYDGQRQYAVENCTQPELKQWILDNLGRNVGGCEGTPMAFAYDVFGASFPLSANLLTLDYWAVNGDTYCEYWRFIPNSDSLRFEAGDVLLYPKPAGGREHYAIVVGETTSWWKQYGIEMDAFAVVEANAGTGLVTLAEEGYRSNYIGILRPDFSQTLANRPNTDLPTVPDVDAPNLSTASAWAHDGINSAVAKGFVPADLQDKYTNTITRAEFCSLAVTLYENIKGTIAGRTTFTDTNDVNVEKAAFIGVVSGVGNNKFDGSGTLTREQAAVMLSRLADAMGKPLPIKVSTFSDNAQISSWALDAVGQIQSAGVMSGTGNNMFSPQQAYSREQSILTILRLYDVVK